MDKERYYKYLFITGAFFNWINALTFTILSISFPQVFTLFGTSMPPTLFFLHSLLGLIFTYGIGYFIIGLDITKNRGVVWLGVISKLFFFTMCVLYFVLGDIAGIMVILGSGDLIYACLFIEFLINFKKKGVK
ncbi:MAG: hypothetical protein ACTSUN_02755 [Promethearchaeota archaeon]